jgi:dTDP-4-dehydrorhamnose 3,5-epimerase
MQVTNTPLDGLVLIQLRVFKDDRGWFLESYNSDRFQAAGLKDVYLQDNHSSSVRHTLRGLHFQTRPGQAKLIRCTQGRIWDVAVDIRPSSPTFGRHHALELSQGDGQLLHIPIGFAHGFLVLSESAEVQYKCSSVYDAATESGIQWDDPELSVAWPLGGAVPLISDRDAKNPSFAEFKRKIPA